MAHAGITRRRRVVNPSRAARRSREFKASTAAAVALTLANALRRRAIEKTQENRALCQCTPTCAIACERISLPPAIEGREAAAMQLRRRRLANGPAIQLQLSSAR